MKNGKSSLSKSQSYSELGKFWDRHDLAERWDKTKKVKVYVHLESEMTYCALDPSLAEKVYSLARSQGMSPDTVINLWIQEKLQEKLNEKRLERNPR